LSTVDLAVNGSILGMKLDDRLPFDPASLSQGAMIADVVTKVVTCSRHRQPALHQRRSRIAAGPGTLDL
jgi:hypothetical protein